MGTACWAAWDNCTRDLDGGGHPDWSGGLFLLEGQAVRQEAEDMASVRRDLGVKRSCVVGLSLPASKLRLLWFAFSPSMSQVGGLG